MNLNLLIRNILLSIFLQQGLDSKVQDNLVDTKFTSSLIKEKKINQQKYNFLIWGGGYSPTGNQVSLESNVKYFHRIKNNIGLKEFSTKTLFADGVDTARDIQFHDPNFEVPEANLLLAEILGSTRGIYNQYRNNHLQPDGSSSINELNKWLQDLNKSSDQSLNLIYFTGHGGKGDKKTPWNTSTYLWNNEKVKVSDFTKKLNFLPPTQSTILVMVQCYSGGFANYVFKDGDPQKGLHPQPRAGFFATVHDRVAAGCTPDIREENYQEYSTRFWEALCGESRTGNKIQKPDYNGDGHTSLLEAHTYVIINSNTIDLPIKTSDVFLRKFSSFDPPKDTNASFYKQTIQNLIKKGRRLFHQNDSNSSGQNFISKSWIYRNDPISEILKVASYESNATIKSLSLKLGLRDKERFEQANKKIEEFKKEREQLSKSKKQKDEESKKLKTKIRNRIKKEWPELANIHHPQIDIIKREDGTKKLISLANINNDWENFKKLKAQISAIEQQRFRLEKKQVLAMRLIYEIENVVLREAFPKINTPDLIERYSIIEKLEKTIFDQQTGQIK